MKFNIQLASELIKASNGKLSLGVLFSQVRVSKTTPALDNLMNTCVSELSESGLNGNDVETLPQVKAVTETYKALGKNSKFKGSNESLLKRIVEGSGIYRINTVVDINNLISLESRRSLGSYDLSKLGTQFVFRAGTKGEKYIGTSKRSVDLDNLPVLSDESGPFGSPTSDSTRALISDSTQYLMTVIFSFDGTSGLTSQLESLETILRENAQAQNVQTAILTDKSPKAHFSFGGYDEIALLSESVPALQFTKAPEQKTETEEEESTCLNRKRSVSV